MARQDNFFEDESSWLETPKKDKVRRLVELAKRRAYLIVKDRDFIFCEARIILGDLDTSSPKPNLPVGVDPFYATIKRYDFEGSRYIAKKAVESLRIPDERIYTEVFDRVTDELKTFGTRREYVQTISNEIKRIDAKIQAKKRI